MRKIFVIGGGPAGMMAAIRAGQLGGNVTLVEKNPSLGRKLLLTGNGRCNLTNTCALDKFLERFFTGGQFLRDAFKALSNRDLIRFFEMNGLEFKVEEGKVFPVTDSSSSVLGILEKELERANVRLIMARHIEDAVIREGKVIGSALSDGTGMIECDRLVLATGGLSYASTGSTGDGFRIAKELGHKVNPLRAGLVPLESIRPFAKALEGLVLKDVRLTFRGGKKKVVEEKAALLFTAYGISGPAAISASSKIGDWLAESLEVWAEIDMEPGRSESETDAFLLRKAQAHINRSICNIIKDMYPERFVDVMLELAGVDPSCKASRLTQKDRASIVRMLKGFRVDIKSARPIEEAMITRGGVSLKEVNPRTMGSRLVEGLYFAGEILDIDADTGGFNLQAAFSTGWLAGQSAAGE